MVAELAGPVVKISVVSTDLYTVMFPATSRSSAGNVKLDAPVPNLKTVSELNTNSLARQRSLLPKRPRSHALRTANARLTTERKQ
jgi:hypothetical protein